MAAAQPKSGIDAVVAENPFAARHTFLAHVVDFALGGVPHTLRAAKRLYYRAALWWLRRALEAPPSPLAADPIQVIQHIAPRPIMLVGSRSLVSVWLFRGWSPSRFSGRGSCTARRTR